MSTDNTDHRYYWYRRNKGKNGVIGIHNEDGEAPDAVHDIEIWYSEVPDEISSTQDEIPVPLFFEHAFAMGVAYEVMRMLGKEIRSYKKEFEDMLADARGYNNDESKSPQVILPLDMRHD